MQGNPKYEATQNIPNVPYHRFAELIGLKGIFVDDTTRMASAWDEALESDTPVLLEVKTDPEVPPLPAHISFEQARNFAATLFKGDPEEGALIAGAARQVFARILPSEKE